MKYCSCNSAEDRTRDVILRFNPSEEYIVYGTGECYHFMKRFLGDLINIKFCIDKRASSGSYQIGKDKVFAPETLHNFIGNKIIIAANGAYYFEIRESLLKLGYSEELLCSAFEIATAWGMEYRKNIISMYVSFPILSACTLNCRGCIHYTDYHKKGFYLQKDEIKESIDLYFTCVDVVDQIQIFGGEPFLHRDLDEICLYISEKYATRYHKMLVTTNGTIVPKVKVMENLSKCSNLVVSISDYSQTNEDRLSIDHLVELCGQAKVPYNINSNFYRSDSENLWFDCGNPNEKKEAIDVKSRFSNCALPGFGVFKNRYYYCPNSMFASITDIFPEGRDWLDLKRIAFLSRQERNAELLAWHLGFMKNGSLDFCSYCAGFGKWVNSNYIRAGEQL